MIEKIKETGRKVWIFSTKLMAMLFIFLLGGLILPQEWRFSNLVEVITQSPQWVAWMPSIIIGGILLLFAVLAVITFFKKE